MRLLPATIDDIPFIADVMTATDPDDPWDPALWAHKWRVWQASGFPSRTYLVESHGRRAGFAEWWWRQPVEDAGPRFGSLRVGLTVEDGGLFQECLRSVEVELREQGVDRFATSTRESEAFRPRALQVSGYRPDRLERWWELDLDANREAILAAAAAARRRMADQEVTITTLAAVEDPDLLRRMYEVSRAAEADVPTTVPHVPLPYEAWLRDLESPAVRRERVWVALAGREVLGMSWLAYPVERGHVDTDWTCTSRSARGRGIARALKLETLAQAIELGVGRVRTENDEENAPILHINAGLGYRPIPGQRLWVKDAD